MTLRTLMNIKIGKMIQPMRAILNWTRTLNNKWQSLFLIVLQDMQMILFLYFINHSSQHYFGSSMMRLLQQTCMVLRSKTLCIISSSTLSLYLSKSLSISFSIIFQSGTMIFRSMITQITQLLDLRQEKLDGRVMKQQLISIFQKL